jgi:spore germination cell wall hydrolase CwlJ-like protein
MKTLAMLTAAMLFAQPAMAGNAFSLVESADKAEVKCLADNIYHEANNQGYVGKLAVAFVTINRARDSKFPTSICQVVNQKKKDPKTGKSTCQFSWKCEKRKPINKEQYENALEIAASVYLFTEMFEDPTEGSLFFHSSAVKNHPFFRQLVFVVQIGDHLFYDEK